MLTKYEHVASHGDPAYEGFCSRSLLWHACPGSYNTNSKCLTMCYIVFNMFYIVFNLFYIVVNMCYLVFNLFYIVLNLFYIELYVAFRILCVSGNQHFQNVRGFLLQVFTDRDGAHFESVDFGF